MPLKKIPVAPGFDKQETASQAEGRWIDGDNVRFRYGNPEKIPFNPKPGTFVFFNSYLCHEFVVDHGIEPFRFIHFNIKAIPKQLINNGIKRI